MAQESEVTGHPVRSCVVHRGSFRAFPPAISAAPGAPHQSCLRLALQPLAEAPSSLRVAVVPWDRPWRRPCEPWVAAAVPRSPV